LIRRGEAAKRRIEKRLEEEVINHGSVVVVRKSVEFYQIGSEQLQLLGAV
jgi:hypothetical protein